MRSSIRAFAALSLVLSSASAIAAGTPAGTTINNTATVSYEDPPGTPQLANSNTASVVVDELLNVTVANGGNETVFSPDTNQPLAFTVTNTGNGTEDFELTFANVAGDNFDPTNVRFFLDDGDGVFDAGDTLITFLDNVPADASRLVFVVGDIPAGRADGDTSTVSLTALAVTATAGDTPGVTYPAQGDGGTDAVVGASSATDVDQSSYLVSQINASLVKTQSVTDPFGGSNAVPGATITYTLTFTLTGSGSITVGQITDPIPANTTYVPGSLTLNAGALTDGADADAGRFTGTGVEVNLGSPLNAPTTQTVTFRVTIN